MYLRSQLNKRISNPGCYGVVGIGPTVPQPTIIKLYKIYETNAFFICSKYKNIEYFLCASHCASADNSSTILWSQTMNSQTKPHVTPG